MTVEDRAGATPATVYVNRISDGFLSAMGTPLRRGRDFTEQDGQGPPVAIVNEALAQRFFRNEDAIGRRVTLGYRPESRSWVWWRTRNASPCAGTRRADHLRLGAEWIRQRRPAAHNRDGGRSPAACARDPARSAIHRRRREGAAAPHADRADRSIAGHRAAGGPLARRVCGPGAPACGSGLAVACSVTRSPGRTGEIGLRLALGAGAAGCLFCACVLRESALCSIAIGFAPDGIAARAAAPGALLFDLKPSDPLILIGGACPCSPSPWSRTAPACAGASRVDPLWRRCGSVIQAGRVIREPRVCIIWFVSRGWGPAKQTNKC